MSYSLEQRESDRGEMQEFNSPRPHGEIVTEEDLILWKQQKQKQEEEK